MAFIGFKTPEKGAPVKGKVDPKSVAALIAARKKK